jgi:hypothetical protein
MLSGSCPKDYPNGYCVTIPTERIPNTVPLGCNDAMSIKATRRQNLIRLISERFEWNKAAFARAIDRPAPNVHRMLVDVESDKDKRGIGEELARDIESRLGLPPLWLDQGEQQGEKSYVPAAALTDLQSRYDKAGKKKQAVIDDLLELPEDEVVRLLPLVESLKQKHQDDL